MFDHCLFGMDRTDVISSPAEASRRLRSVGVCGQPADTGKRITKRNGIPVSNVVMV